MKSLIEYINEATVNDIKVGTEIYFRFHDSQSIHKLTITKVETSNLYVCCYVKENDLDISYFGISEKEKKNDLYLIWTGNSGAVTKHGYASFEEEPLTKELPEDLEKAMNDIMRKICEYENQIIDLQYKISELDAKKKELEKKLNKEIK